MFKSNSLNVFNFFWKGFNDFSRQYINDQPPVIPALPYPK